MRDLFYGGLAAILLKSAEAFGSVWAWRVTRLAHAVPYVIGAAAFGWVSTWVWGSPLFSPSIGSWLCAGVVTAGMCWDWWKEWRRG